MPLQETLRIPVTDGSLHLTVQGSGTPVLLVHGIFSSGFCWRHVASLLALHHTVYTVDLLGFGDSDMPAGADYSQSAQAHRLHELIQSLDLRNLHLVGHSMGGEIAVHAVLQGPTPFRTLTLVAADGFRPAFTRWQRSLLSGVWIRWFVRRTFDEKGLQRTLGLLVEDRTCFTEDVVKGYVTPYRRPEFPQAVCQIARSREGGLAPDRCRDITLPSLLLWGDNDRIVPRRIGDTYHEMMPHADYRLCPNCGHLPMEEHPDWLAGEMLRFFHTHEKNRP
jgi:pimeloyl-ACP methyl ester carboxylesterase